MKKIVSAVDVSDRQKQMVKALQQLKREGGKLFSRRDFELRAYYLISDPKKRGAFVTVMMAWRERLIKDAVAKALGRKRWKDSKGRGVLTRMRMDLRKLLRIT
jgi:hypothetical protein